MGAVPVDWSVNCTVNGDRPCTVSAVNCAVGVIIDTVCIDWVLVVEGRISVCADRGIDGGDVSLDESKGARNKYRG
jgi:hypothetical protein